MFILQGIVIHVDDNRYIGCCTFVGISEEPLPGGVVGETFGHIIAEQFRRLKYADRFWHETADKNLGFDHSKL